VRKLVAALALLLLAAFVADSQTHTFPALDTNNTFTGSNAFAAISASGQITSTVTTGTAPFSIASTTVTPNLNAQLLNGLTAPASAIVGINDSQTLAAKTLTTPVINVCWFSLKWRVGVFR
jgi:hypothetical protein